MTITIRKGVEGEEEDKGEENGDGKGLDFGGKHTMEYTDDIL